MVYPDQQLATSFVEGTERDVAPVYDRYGAMVYRIARGVLGNPADAEEVTQATFVSAWQGRGTFDPERGSLAAWLIGIARRRTVDRVARDRARAQGHRRGGAVADGARRSSTPTAHTDQVVDRIVVTDGLAQLAGRSAARAGTGVLR